MTLWAKALERGVVIVVLLGWEIWGCARTTEQAPQVRDQMFLRTGDVLGLVHGKGEQHKSHCKTEDTDSTPGRQILPSKRQLEYDQKDFKTGDTLGLGLGEREAGRYGHNSRLYVGACL